MVTDSNWALGQAVKLTAAAGLLALLQACAAPQQQPAPTQPAPPPTVEAESLGGRMLADAQEYPWSALGRLNLAGHGFCTGVLIGPRQVLTGAGCLYAARENRWWQPQELHFIAAYQKDSFLADSGIADFTVAPGYNPQAGTSLANVTSNWAIVTLQKPIGAQTGWLGLEWDSRRLQQAAQSGTAVYLRAGYRTDWPHAVSLHFGCDEGAGGLVSLCARVARLRRLRRQHRRRGRGLPARPGPAGQRSRRHRPAHRPHPRGTTQRKLDKIRGRSLNRPRKVLWRKMLLERESSAPSSGPRQRPGPISRS